MTEHFYSVCVVLLMLLCVQGCGPMPQHHPAPVTDGWHVSGQTSDYVVREGDTVYSIAWAFALDPEVIVSENHLSGRYTIHPGQRLSLEYARLQANQGPPPRPKKQPIPKQVNKKVEKKPDPGIKITKIESNPNGTSKSVVKPQANADWVWPAKGKHTLIDRNPGTGIEIANTLGTPIVAAQAGRVVYSGEGLRGYGKLLIIKHKDNILTAYAHNQQRLVEEGMMVAKGQKIATMGQTAAGDVKLYFEVRRAGQPVSPLLFLSTPA